MSSSREIDDFLRQMEEYHKEEYEKQQQENLYEEELAKQSYIDAWRRNIKEGDTAWVVYHERPELQTYVFSVAISRIRKSEEKTEICSMSQTLDIADLYPSEKIADEEFTRVHKELCAGFDCKDALYMLINVPDDAKSISDIELQNMYYHSHAYDNTIRNLNMQAVIGGKCTEHDLNIIEDYKWLCDWYRDCFDDSGWHTDCFRKDTEFAAVIQGIDLQGCPDSASVLMLDGCSLLKGQHIVQISDIVTVPSGEDDVELQYRVQEVYSTPKKIEITDEVRILIDRAYAERADRIWKKHEQDKLCEDDDIEHDALF